QLREGGTIPGGLADGLVKQNDAADRLLDAFGGKQQLAVGAPIILSRFYLDAVESPLDGSRAFIGSENSFAFCHQSLSDRFEFLLRHGFYTSLLFCQRVILHCA